jgi:phospholipid/cholesterol/gamma-HCH transport system substrate-binding protein
MTAFSRTGRRIVVLLVAVLLLAGCGFRGAYSFSLPGGADVGDNPYRVKVQFLDVLDLVPQSGVRVADVPVGRVEKIELGHDWTAVVTIVVNGDVKLPANSVAAIQQTSLLGEKFVELAAPGNEQAQGRLKDGDTIPLPRTNRNVEVEELLGALSLVLNGGGLAQLQTINHELGNALEGRESKIQDTLHQLDTFIGGLDQQRAEINRALDSADRLVRTLSSRTETIKNALDAIGPGLDVINQQRDLLVSMLKSLARLGDVGTRIINEAAANTVEDLRLLQPILSQLAAAGDDLTGSLSLLLTYPFPDSSLSALNYRKAQSGGEALFTNMTATVDMDLSTILCRYVIDPADGSLKLRQAGLAPDQCGVETGTTGGGPGGSPTPGGGLPTLPGVNGQAPSGQAPSGPVGLPDVTGAGQ